MYKLFFLFIVWMTPFYSFSMQDLYKKELRFILKKLEDESSFSAAEKLKLKMLILRKKLNLKICIDDKRDEKNFGSGSKEESSEVSSGNAFDSGGLKKDSLQYMSDFDTHFNGEE